MHKEEHLGILYKRPSIIFSLAAISLAPTINYSYSFFINEQWKVLRRILKKNQNRVFTYFDWEILVSLAKIARGWVDVVLYLPNADLI